MVGCWFRDRVAGDFRRWNEATRDSEGGSRFAVTAIWYVDSRRKIPSVSEPERREVGSLVTPRADWFFPAPSSSGAPYEWPALVYRCQREPRRKAGLCHRRSEEHTSELQHPSISYAVFCLKKKKKKQ